MRNKTLVINTEISWEIGRITNFLVHLMMLLYTLVLEIYSLFLNVEDYTIKKKINKQAYEKDFFYPSPAVAFCFSS